jgi:hypothetical protein
MLKEKNIFISAMHMEIPSALADNTEASFSKY